jgi:hypothetical protein
MVTELYFSIKYPRFSKMDKNKCPKMKTQKNFPPKISYIGTTYEGNFFGDFYHNSTIFPSSCSEFVFK